MTVAEARNPRRNIPKALRNVCLCVFVLYIGGLFVIGLLVPSSNPLLDLNSNNIPTSPFVIAFTNAGIKVLPSVCYESERLFRFQALNTSCRSSTLRFYHLLGLLLHVTSTSHRVVYVCKQYFSVIIHVTNTSCPRWSCYHWRCPEDLQSHNAFWVTSRCRRNLFLLCIPRLPDNE